MKKLKLNLKNIFTSVPIDSRLRRDKKESDIDLIVEYLKKGKVVVLPTDTIYGLHGDATSKKTIKKMRKITKRSKLKPYLILVSSLAMLKKYCYLDKKQTKLLQEFWGPKAKPTSVVLKSRGILPRQLTAGLDSVAVRLPKSDFLTTIVERVGVPVISTSLNISGQKPLTSVESLDNYFKEVKPDLVVNAGKIKGSPSRLVDLRDADDVKVLRE